MKYDIFISYRREGGYDTAKHLYDLLVRDGYKVSFDIDTLRNGDFDLQLLTRIDQCNDFILIVDKHAFDRTLDPDFDPNKDWLRCELAYALKQKKNIIPIFLAGVSSFPEGLPQDIAEITKKNGPEYNRYYFNDFYNTLKKRFLHSKRTQQKFIIPSAIGIILTAAIISYTIFNDAHTMGNDIAATETAETANIDSDKYYPKDMDTRHLYIKGLRNGIEYYPAQDQSNEGCNYLFKDGRVINIKQIFYQTGMWFTATDESDETTSLPIDFKDIGYTDATHQVEYNDNEYLIGQCDIDGDSRDELVVAVRTNGERWLDNEFGNGIAINFFKLVGGRWELLTSLITNSNVQPINAKIVNNNVYIYWLRYDEKYTLVGNEFVYAESEGRVFKKSDFK